MSAVVDWTLDRPPILDIDFPNDHANGERARDVWYESRRRPNDETLPVVDLLASEVMQKQQRHERSLLWKKALRRYNNKQRNPEAEAQRKRSERLLTNLRAGLGDAEAEMSAVRWCASIAASAGSLKMGCPKQIARKNRNGNAS